MVDCKELKTIAASARFDWGDVRIFLAVAEQGTITAAAPVLQMSQPTISQRLRELERQLSTVLFVRRKTGLHLTHAGERLRAEALPMLRAAQSIDRTLRETDDKLEGRVRLSAPEGVLTFWIAPRLPAFQNANPKISVSLDAGFWPEKPLQDEVHISLQYDKKGFGGLAVEPLATVHYGAFATRQYFDTYGYPETQADLVAHRVIHHVALQQQRETWDPKAEAARTLTDYSIEANSSAALTMALLANGGIAFTPTFAATYFDKLVMVGENPVASPLLYLVYDPRISRVARVVRVMEWLKSIFDAKKHACFKEPFVHPKEYVLAPGSGCLSFSPPSV